MSDLSTPVPRVVSRAALSAHSRRVQHRLGMLLVAALSVLAGMTDAIGFLATGDYVSFMSGNTTRLAIGLGEGHASATTRLLLAVLAFIAGNALGVILVRLSGRRAFPLLVVVAATLAVAAWADPRAWSVLFCVILCMGMLNAAVEQVNGAPVGLTYVTGALSRFGRGLGRWLLGERQSGWLLQLVPWLGMFCGAVMGTLLHLRFGLVALSASAALAALLALAFMRVPRRWQQRYLP